jgi:hypothetical protein
VVAARLGSHRYNSKRSSTASWLDARFHRNFWIVLDRYEKLSQALGVTDTALTNFFRILGVKPEDLDGKLREVAARQVTLLKEAESSADDDPQVAADQEAVD